MQHYGILFRDELLDDVFAAAEERLLVLCVDLNLQFFTIVIIEHIANLRNALPEV